MHSIVVFSHFGRASGGIKGQHGRGGGKGDKGGLGALQISPESESQGEYCEGGQDGKGVAAVMQSASSR